MAGRHRRRFPTWLSALSDRLRFDESCEHICCPSDHGPWLVHLSTPDNCAECRRVARRASA